MIKSFSCLKIFLSLYMNFLSFSLEETINPAAQLSVTIWERVLVLPFNTSIIFSLLYLASAL